MCDYYGFYIVGMESWEIMIPEKEFFKNWKTRDKLGVKTFKTLGENLG